MLTIHIPEGLVVGRIEKMKNKSIWRLFYFALFILLMLKTDTFISNCRYESLNYFLRYIA